MTDGKKCEKSEWRCCPPGKCAYRHLHPTANCPRENLPAAPQQAEAVPSDVARDAERYRWLRDRANVSHQQRATGQGVDYPTTWHIVTGGSDTSIDAAIDAAIAQQKAK